MHRDRDLDLQAGLPPSEATLVQDLALERLFRAMAAGDEFLLNVARGALVASLYDPRAILYRQPLLSKLGFEVEPS